MVLPPAGGAGQGILKMKSCQAVSAKCNISHLVRVAATPLWAALFSPFTYQGRLSITTGENCRGWKYLLVTGDNWTRVGGRGHQNLRGHETDLKCDERNVIRWSRAAQPGPDHQPVSQSVSQSVSTNNSFYSDQPDRATHWEKWTFFVNIKIFYFHNEPDLILWSNYSGNFLPAPLYIIGI